MAQKVIKEKSSLPSEEIQQKLTSSTAVKPCPTDAKVCSDGISVGRTGPNCEFVPCPAEKERPSITVLSPNGGEEWRVGKSYTIAWRTSKFKGFGGTFKVSLIQLNTKTERILFDDFAIDQPSVANVNWTIPHDINPGFYTVLIVATITNPGGETLYKISDVSDAPFNIIAAEKISTWKTYRNVEYGNEMPFPQSWKGYEVRHNIVTTGNWHYISFFIPLKDSSDAEVYVVSVIPKEEWSLNYCIYAEGPCYQGTVLGSNNKYVFEELDAFIMEDPCHYTKDEKFCSVYKDMYKDEFGRRFFRLINK